MLARGHPHDVILPRAADGFAVSALAIVTQRRPVALDAALQSPELGPASAQVRHDLARPPPPDWLRECLDPLLRLASLVRQVDLAPESPGEMHGRADALVLGRALELREERRERLGGLDAGAKDVPDESARGRAAPFARTRTRAPARIRARGCR